MKLLLDLIPVIFPQESRSRIVRVFHEFIKYATIPAVDLKLYARTNIFFVINGLVALQDEKMENYHLLGVTLPSLYTIKLH